MPRYVKSNGADFAFYRPAPMDIDKVWWTTMNSVHFVAEREQIRPWSKDRYFIVPYSSNDRLVLPRFTSHRSTRVYYRGGCSLTRAIGQALRFRMVEALQKYIGDPKTNFDVACPARVPHKEVVRKLQSSIFCLLAPGDTQSSRRLTEIVLGGCIPVFLGPPFHSMPFSKEVDYKAFAVFFKVLNNETLSLWWGDKPVPKRHEFGGVLTDRLDALDEAFEVGNLEEIGQILLALDKKFIMKKQEALARYQHYFQFVPRIGVSDVPTAVDAIIHNMCEAARNTKVPY